MKKFSVSQENNLFTGTDLAAELSASSPERRAFVVIGAYIQTPKGAKNPPKALNADRSDVRFWLRKYEVKKSDLENHLDITDHDVIDSLYLDNIQNIGQLEIALGIYIQDFSLMEVGWKVDYPVP